MAPYLAEPSPLSVGLFDFSQGFDPAALLCVLTAAERDHWRRFAQPGRARQYLASRWLLRAHIASRLGLAPADVPLHHAVGASPRVGDTGWHIGLSHSGRLCLCMVSKRTPAGCDVERHRPRNVNAIAAAYFHPTEAARLAACASEQRLADFYRLWTLKEAALKGRSRGLAAGLRVPAFALAPRLHCIETRPADRWTFAAVTRCLGGVRYSLALAIAGPVRSFSVSQHTPAASGHRMFAWPVKWQFATA